MCDSYSKTAGILISFIIITTLVSCGGIQKKSGRVTIEFRLADKEPAHGLSERIIHQTGEKFYLHEEVLLSNIDVASASVNLWDQHPVVELIFNDGGKKKLSRITRASVNKHIGILIDGELVSAPRIMAPMLEGKAIMVGNFSEEEAQRIADGIVSKVKMTGEGPKLTLKDASRFMQSYTKTLRTGTPSDIYSFWSRRSSQREGFDYMHLWIGACIPITDWANFFQKNDSIYKMKNVRSEYDYNVIDFEWILKDTTNEKGEPETHPMRYYVIWEHDTWVLINPIDLLTEDWLTYESDHFIFHYPPHIDIEDHTAELNLMDREYKDITENLNTVLEDKIDYYKARTPQECGDLICFPPANGYCARALPFRPDAPRWFHIVVSTSFMNLHEVIHLHAPDAELYSINAAFDEGIAVAFGGTTFQTAQLAVILTRNAIGRPEYVPLDILLTDEAAFWENTCMTYQEAGAFVRFLIDQFGLKKLQELCNEPGVTHKLDETIRNIYGFSITELENRMRDYLMRIDVPDVRYSIPEGVEVVFSMTDPQGDDIGDGDYEYPADNCFQKGAFDLRGFQVLKDSERVYFRLRFQNMIDPVKYDSIDEKFVPGAVIALNKGKIGERIRQRRFDGVKFENDKGYDQKLTVGFGVTVSNNFGKVYYSTGNTFHKLTKKGKNEYQFSFPIDFIGEPQRDWKYFVGVGLMGDRAMHFLGGPLPVYKDHRLFISGGNYQSGNPAFIDILLPEGTNQAQLLNKYDAAQGRTTVVPWCHKTN